LLQRERVARHAIDISKLTARASDATNASVLVAGAHAGQALAFPTAIEIDDSGGHDSVMVTEVSALPVHEAVLTRRPDAAASTRRRSPHRRSW
jgi:hypothetical protein